VFLFQNIKWPSPSLRQQAYLLRKKARDENKEIPSDEDIWNHFVKTGKIKAESVYEKQKEPLDLPPTRSISKSKINHKNSPDSNDDSQTALMNQGILKVINEAVMAGKDIPPNLLYLIAVQNFTANPSPQWFTVLQTFMKDRDKIQHSADIQINKPIIYIRPPSFHTKQHQIVEVIKNPKIKLIFVEGCQRSGKSTSVMAALHEVDLETNRPLRVALLAGKGGKNGRDGGSKGILADVLRDPILEEANKTVIDFASRTNESIKWKNGMMELVAMELTVASIKGGDKEIIWIDEMDVAISEGQDKRDAVQSAVNTMLATSDFKLILSSNLDKGIYQVLREAIFELKEECVASISIRKEDCPHLNRDDIASNYTIARTISDALLGDGFGKMRLEGEFTGEGDCFNYVSIQDSFDMYETYWQNIGMKYPSITHMAIDPSGTGHPFGVFIGAYDPLRDEHIEIESFEMQMGDPNTITRDKQSPNRINEILLEKCQKYNVKKVCIESNSGGQAIAIFLRSHKIQVIMQNFGAKNAFNSRSNYVKLANYVLDGRKIVLKYGKLKSELTIYNPDIDKGEHKGDAADAFLHYLWLACGGMAYLMREARSKSHAGTDSKFSAV
jgi:hypothetical protein